MLFFANISCKTNCCMVFIFYKVCLTFLRSFCIKKLKIFSDMRRCVRCPSEIEIAKLDFLKKFYEKCLEIIIMKG